MKRYFARWIAYIQERKQARFDHIAIYIFPICSALLATVFATNYFYTIILFYGLPSVYLSLRYSRYIKKAFFFALIFGSVFTIPLDYLAHLNGAWEIIAPGYRILEFIPVTDFMWAILIVYLIAIHHEGIAHHQLNDNVYQKRTKLFLNSMIAVLLLFMIIKLNFPQYLEIDYFYFKAGIVALIIPAFFWLHTRIKVALSFFKTAVFFTLTSILHEIVALNSQHWIFPKSGMFIGYVPFFTYMIPIEEYLFFFILLSVGILTYYEFFEESQARR